MEEEGRDLIRDLGYLVQVCRGLQCVHERGVVHRDLKPENLFVTDDGIVKLMDFGIAKRQSTQGNLTVQGFSAGTPAYMSPEQIENFAATTHLSDIYSLGVIAYRLFTGELPFENENPMAVLMKHLKELPRPPSEIDPSIPDELEYMILQLLEKQPSSRIQSCAEIASDLENLRGRLASPRRR
jgi:serine/threonine protein kinase